VKSRNTFLALGAALALTSGVALAQQPAQPARPMPGQPGALPRPMPGAQQLPGGHPGVPGMPGARPGMPGGMPGGHPGMPGTRPGQPRPGLPPGFNPHRPRPTPHVEEEEHGGGHHECPGHGAEDPPPPPNWWRGILMVNNERASKGGFVNELLFRYENEKNPCDEKNQPPPFLASVLNFGLLAFVLYRFGKKPLAEALLKRKQGIMAEIDTASQLKEDAEARLEDLQEKIDNIESKLDEVRKEYAAQAEQEKKHLLAEAEERRVRMRKDAEFRIEQELKTARAELLQEAVINAVGAAEALVAKQVAQKDQDKMAADYLATIGDSLSGAR
jgi:F-type H+-transporting ATPase subunit b